MLAIDVSRWIHRFCIGDSPGWTQRKRMDWSSLKCTRLRIEGWVLVFPLQSETQGPEKQSRYVRARSP